MKEDVNYLAKALSVGALFLLCSPASGLSQTGDLLVERTASRPRAFPSPEIASQDGLLTIEAKNAEIRVLLGLLAEKTGVPIVVAPDVTGVVSVTVRAVGLEEAMRRILEALGQKNFAVEYSRDPAGKGAVVGLAIQKVHVVKQSNASSVAGPAPSVLVEEKNGKLLDALRSGRRDREDWALMEMLKSGRAALPVVMAALDFKDTRIRLGAIQIAGLLGLKETVPRLITLAASGGPSVQQAAILGLGELGDPRATKPLEELYASGVNPTVRLVILKSMNTLGDKKAIPFLETQLASDDKMVQMFAAGALGSLGNGSGLARALRYSREGDGGLKAAAVLALGLIGDGKALPMLAEISAKDTGEMKMMSYLAMRLIEMKGKSVDELVQILGADVETTGPIGIWAAKELKKIGTPAAVAALRTHTKDKSGRARPDVVNYLFALGEGN